MSDRQLRRDIRYRECLIEQSDAVLLYKDSYMQRIAVSVFAVACVGSGQERFQTSGSPNGRWWRVSSKTTKAVTEAAPQETNMKTK